MQAGMTLADIRRSERMAQLPKELHETIRAEFPRTLRSTRCGARFSA
jgi:hypothetical protein